MVKVKAKTTKKAEKDMPTAYTADGHKLRVGDVVSMAGTGEKVGSYVRIEEITRNADGSPRLLVQGVDVVLRPMVVRDVGQPFTM